MDIEVDGEAKSASSIIQIQYYGGGGKQQARSYYTYTQGVAPVIDLGPHGWLVAAMGADTSEHFRRRKALGLTCTTPRDADSLPGVFGMDAVQLTKVRQGKRELAEHDLPAFIWFPRDEPYAKSAEQLCPEEFSSVIGASVRLSNVTIEIAPDAPLKTKLEISPPWLESMRADQGDYVGGSPYNRYYPNLWRAIETNPKATP